MLKDIRKDPVQSNMAQEANHIKKKAVDIIITPAEEITASQEFYDKGILQIIPVRTG